MKGLSAYRADPAGQIGRRIAQRLRKFCKGRVRIALFQIAEYGAAEVCLRRSDAQGVCERVAVIGEIGKEQRDEPRIDFVRAVDDGIDQVVHQIADRKVVAGVKEEVFAFAGFVKVVDQEFAHHGIVLYAVKDDLQKGVGKNKVDADVRLFRAPDGVPHVPVEKEDIALFERDRLLSDDVRNAAGVDVHEFHVVMSVLREVDKAGMRPQIELFPVQEFGAVDDKAVGCRIVALFHLSAP